MHTEHISSIRYKLFFLIGKDYPVEMFGRKKRPPCYFAVAAWTSNLILYFSPADVCGNVLELCLS